MLLFGTKRKLSTAFYPQTNSKIKRQNSIIKTYLQAFLNWEQNDQAKLLPIVKFAYNNAKNMTTDHISFEFNCNYHLFISFEDETNPCLKFRSANKLAKELRNLILIYQQILLHTQKLQKHAYDKGRYKKRQRI